MTDLAGGCPLGHSPLVKDLLKRTCRFYTRRWKNETMDVELRPRHTVWATPWNTCGLRHAQKAPRYASGDGSQRKPC